MCGIVGLVNYAGVQVDPRDLHRATDAIAHRGPDDEGYVLVSRSTGRAAAFCGPSSPGEVRERTPSIATAGAWAEANAPDVALGHRRFSIIDPTPDGHQPFWDASRTVCVVFNGEIYNYLEVRSELIALGHSFRTASDTEVLVEAYRAWGDGCFERLNGMWSAAFYDFERRELVLARDRTGERPLYWARTRTGIRFASEIRALLAVAGDVAPAVEPDTVYAFLATATSDRNTRTFYTGIEHVPAATVVRVDAENVVTSRRYWQVDQPRDASLASAPVGPLADELFALLRDSVRLRMRADVPVTVALSGGMDSSSVVAAGADLFPNLETYTVRFQEKHSNEWPFARAVVERCGVRNRAIDPPHAWTFQYLAPFVESLEEPFHAPDLLADHVIRRILAKDGFRVSLSGIGGDELFAGYELYRWLYAKDLKRGGDVLRWGRELLLASDGNPGRALARRVLSRLRPAESPRQDLMGTAVTDFGAWQADALPHTAEARLRADVDSLLLPYWLRAGDKSSMAIPMEVRYPFLDHRLIEFAARLPLSLLIRNGWMKWILRKATEDALPRGVVWRRRKMGFPYPVAEWMAEGRRDLLAIFGEMDNPFLDRRFWTSQLDLAVATNPYFVWRALSVELWHRRFVRGLPVLPDGVAARAAEQRVA